VTAEEMGMWVAAVTEAVDEQQWRATSQNVELFEYLLCIN